MRRLPFFIGLCVAATASAQTIPAAFERDVLHELNRARGRPAEVAAELRRYRAAMSGLIAYEPGLPEGVLTEEGAAAVDEAIAFLDAQAPLPALADSETLARAAFLLVGEQARTGEVGHVARGWGDLGARVRAAGGRGDASETVAYGFGGAAAAVRQFIVDDGVPDRGHRRLVFSRAVRFAGVGCATHPAYRQACAISYSATPDAGPAQVAAR